MHILTFMWGSLVYIPCFIWVGVASKKAQT